MRDGGKGYGESVKRKLFTFASLLSLLICVATVALWIRSYYRLDGVSLRFASHLEIAAKSEQGTVTLILTRYPKTRFATKFEARTWKYHFYDLFDSPDSTMDRILTSNMHRSLWGYEEGRFPGLRAYSSREAADADFAVPDYKRWFLMPRLWVVAAVFGILPLAYVPRSWARRPRDGKCRSCGYDLTGNTSGICPECGMEVMINNTRVAG
jgi:hypothetical protein